MKKLISMSIILSLVLVFIPVQESQAILVQTWEHGEGVEIRGIALFSNGNVFLGGDLGKYQIIDENGNNIVNGTWPHGSTTIRHAGVLPNGNTVCIGSEGRYMEINEDGDIVTSGILSDFADMTTITGFTICPNGNIFLTGHAGISPVKYILADSSYNTIKCAEAGVIYSKFSGNIMSKAFNNNSIMFGTQVGGNNGYFCIINSAGNLIVTNKVFYNGGEPLYMEPMSNGNIAMIDYTPFGDDDSMWVEISPTGTKVHSYELGRDKAYGGKLGNGNFVAVTRNLYTYFVQIISPTDGVIDSYNNSDYSAKLNLVLYNDYLFLVGRVDGSNRLIMTDLQGNIKAEGTYNVYLANFSKYLEMNDNKILIARQGYYQILQRADDITDFQTSNITANSIPLSFSFPTTPHAFKVGWKKAIPSTWAYDYTYTNSHTFVGLIPDTLYDLRVQTKITDNTVWYATTEYTIPALPVEINTPSITQDTINLFWNNQDNPDDVSYTVQRKLNEDVWDGLSHTDLVTEINISQYEDIGLMQDEEYTYRIRVNAKNGNYYYSEDYETFTTADPAVAAAEAARSMAEAAAQAADEARDATIESRQYSLEARDTAQATYDLVDGLNLDARLTNIENGSNIPPMIKSVKTLNNVTLTRTGSITVIIDAVNGSNYKASLLSGAGDWSESNAIVISSLAPGVNTIYVQTKNNGELTDNSSIVVFYLP
ncbi:hypothetical protein ASZ90_017578 [hydrocarbon metagenome]|uniref:Fibronectin type-III domain-containing protein n=1 Tax=hydrocarbon metagenome TaxID=938273 RepID=A0A0W8E9L7_9ZZZZ